MPAKYIVSGEVAQRQNRVMSSIGKNAAEFYPYYAGRQGENRDDTV